MGVEIFKDDYGDINLVAAYFIYAYRNAIGDVQTPGYNYWLTGTQEHPYINWIIILIIWIFWLANQIINLVILLNFLIALISESYAKIMSESTIHSY